MVKVTNVLSAIVFFEIANIPGCLIALGAFEESRKYGLLFHVDCVVMMTFGMESQVHKSRKAPATALELANKWSLKLALQEPRVHHRGSMH